MPSPRERDKAAQRRALPRNRFDGLRATVCEQIKIPYRGVPAPNYVEQVENIARLSCYVKLSPAEEAALRSIPESWEILEVPV